MAFKTIILEKKDRIGYLTFNRPDVLNAISEELTDETREAVSQIGQDEGVLVLIITGAGKAFMAGADISEVSTMGPLELHKWNQKIVKNLNALEKLRQPVIAAINGFALGGGLELAMACDIRIASEKVRVGLPEVKLGLIPGAGGTQRLPRLVGRGRAMELMLTAKMVDAQEAYRIGLVNKVVPAEELMKAAEEMANEIIANAPIAVQLVKDAVQVGTELPLEAAIEYGHKNVVASIAAEDAKEGLTAFLEKRSPRWQGK